MSNKRNNNSNDHNDKINHNDNNHNNNDDDDDDDNNNNINNNDCNNDDKTIIDRFMITLTNKWWSLTMIVVIIIIIIDHHDDLGVVKMIIVVVIIIITMPLMIHHHHQQQQQQQQHRQDIDGWWRGFFILFLNYMNWLRETYSNDSAFIILVIVSYCGQQIYFTHKHATTICSQAIPLTMNHRDLIPYRQIKTKYRNINLYHGCTAHVCTAKTGDSHINRLQSIQCLIVSGLGGTVIVGGRCNTRIVRLATRKIAITFLIFGRSLPNFSQTWAMFRCNTYVILKKI